MANTQSRSMPNEQSHEGETPNTDGQEERDR